MNIELDSVLTEEEFAKANEIGAPLTKGFQKNVWVVRVLLGIVGGVALIFVFLYKNPMFMIPLTGCAFVLWQYPKILMSQMIRNTRRQLGGGFEQLLALHYSLEDKGFRVSVKGYVPPDEEEEQPAELEAGDATDQVDSPSAPVETQGAENSAQTLETEEQPADQSPPNPKKGGKKSAKAKKSAIPLHPWHDVVGVQQGEEMTVFLLKNDQYLPLNMKNFPKNEQKAFFQFLAGKKLLLNP